MHILFIGYGKTSTRVAKQLFQQGHQITTISQSPKTDVYANHLIQDVHQLNLTQIKPIDWVYILLSPSQSTVEGYQQTYVDTVAPIVHALKLHPVQRIVVVSSTRVYGENAGSALMMNLLFVLWMSRADYSGKWSSFISRHFQSAVW